MDVKNSIIFRLCLLSATICGETNIYQNVLKYV